MSITNLARNAKENSSKLMSITEIDRRLALEMMALNLLAFSDEILHENKKDVNHAKQMNLKPSLIDRLILTQASIEAMAKGCLDIADQEQVVGTITDTYTRPNNLIIKKERIPLGVIGMIFESRPNVVIDGAALAIKSGNSIILKGGKEAAHTSHILHTIVQESIRGILSDYSVNMVYERADVEEMLKLDQYIDLMVPRGGSSLIQFVKDHAKMPVVAHDKGLCHLYVHQDAKAEIVIPIILNSKTQRPGVCNALESLLIHEKYHHIKNIIDKLIEEKVEVRGCSKTKKIHKDVKLATLDDYATEYLDKIISIKIVSDLDEAISHIKKHSSHHTEAILTESEDIAEKFMKNLDSSCIMVNASTRFNDGGELGLGAELGISTSKLHAYGPMGAKEMTTTRFIVIGNGQTR